MAIIPVILGMAIGAVIMFFVLKRQLAAQLQTQQQQARKAVAELEQIHQLHLYETTQALQADFEARLQQATSQLKQQHQAQLQTATQTLQQDYKARLEHVTAELEQEYQTRLQLALQSSEPEPNPIAQVEQELVTEVLTANPAPASPFRTERGKTSTEQESSQEIGPTAVPSEFRVEVQDAELLASSTPEQSRAVSVFSSSKITNLTPDDPSALVNQIRRWGSDGQLTQVTQVLKFASHSDPLIREAVATALGQMAQRYRLRAEMKPAIAVLGKLSQDPNIQVRQQAVVALGCIQSEKVFPYLKRALRDPSIVVTQVAAIAVRRIKPIAVKRSAGVRKRPKL